MSRINRASSPKGASISKISTEAKRVAVTKAFGNIPHLDEGHYLNWLYDRRRCAKVSNGKWRDLRYGIELEELMPTVRKALDRIRKRDGAWIASEVAAALVDSIDVD
jgi:hypothetical protein